MATRERTTIWVLGSLIVLGVALVYLGVSRRTDREAQNAPLRSPWDATGSAAPMANQIAARSAGWPSKSTDWRQLAEQALGANDYDLARRCARLTEPAEVSDALLAAIDRAEGATLRRMLRNRVNGLHARAERAIEERDFPAAETLLQEARLLLVNQKQTERVHRTTDGQHGELVITIAGHNGAVNAVAVNAAGTLLASGGDDLMVKVWEARSGSLVAVAAGHTGRVRGVTFNASGAYLLSGSDDRTGRLWNGVTGREIRHVDHGAAVSCVGFSPGGHYFLTGGNDKKVKLWETSTGQLIATYPHGRPVTCLAVSRDGRSLLSGGADGSIKLWEVASATCVQPMRGTGREAITSIVFSPDDATCLVGGKDGSLHLYQISSGQKIGSLPPHKGAVTGAAFDPLGRGVYSVGADRAFHIAALDPQAELIALTHPDPLRSLAVSQAGDAAVTGDAMGKLSLWHFAAFGR